MLSTARVRTWSSQTDLFQCGCAKQPPLLLVGEGRMKKKRKKKKKTKHSWITNDTTMYSPHVPLLHANRKLEKFKIKRTFKKKSTLRSPIMSREMKTRCWDTLCILHVGSESHFCGTWGHQGGSETAEKSKTHVGWEQAWGKRVWVLWWFSVQNTCRKMFHASPSWGFKTRLTYSLDISPTQYCCSVCYLRSEPEHHIALDIKGCNFHVFKCDIH